MKIIDAPALDGWVGLTEAAEMLGISRQHCWRMATRKKWASLHRVGSSDVYVVSLEEVEQKRSRRMSYAV